MNSFTAQYFSLLLKNIMILFSHHIQILEYYFWMPVEAYFTHTEDSIGNI